ncbi:tRNA 2'-phosphotransferase 1-like [Chenopodium quinoa]|uniref:tRNA 2'-phosphotransferase 1-like n=1 Tax=Chenopodium quinoa TaxID=63459 RepID=UPI000B795784|nr:tRNA 2'-phosphotransferase 1-like [Chenopodium quinoa]
MSRGRESCSFFSHLLLTIYLAGGRKHGHTRGNRGGSRGRGCGAPTGTSDRVDTLGRLLVRVLRHDATELNLDMHSDGYVKLQDILKLNMKTRSNIPLSSHAIDEIREAVRIDNKQRLSLMEEDGELWIRANQGHTIKRVRVC